MEEELIDFFEGRGRFGARNEYVGMDASSIPALFIAYFDGLSEVQRMEMARVTASGALADCEALLPYVRPSMRLMGELCLRNHSRYFQGSLEAMERVFTNAGNVETWLQAADPEIDVPGPTFKKEWRYALILWGVLYLLRSEKIGQVYRTLLENACSEHFRESLVRAGKVYDQLMKSR